MQATKQKGVLKGQYRKEEITVLQMLQMRHTRFLPLPSNNNQGLHFPLIRLSKHDCCHERRFFLDTEANQLPHTVLLVQSIAIANHFFLRLHWRQSERKREAAMYCNPQPSQQNSSAVAHVEDSVHCCRLPLHACRYAHAMLGAVAQHDAEGVLPVGPQPAGNRELWWASYP